jgi:hypothetical protein
MTGWEAVGVPPLYGFLAVFVNRLRRRRRMSQLMPQNMIMCCLRVSRGVTPGLDERWRYAEVRLAPGLIVLPTREGGEGRLAVRQVLSEHPRRPRLRELVRDMDTDYRVVRLTTNDAQLEWALPQPWVAWAVARVRRPLPTR